MPLVLEFNLTDPDTALANVLLMIKNKEYKVRLSKDYSATVFARAVLPIPGELSEQVEETEEDEEDMTRINVQLYKKSDETLVVEFSKLFGDFFAFKSLYCEIFSEIYGTEYAD